MLAANVLFHIQFDVILEFLLVDMSDDIWLSDLSCSIYQKYLSIRCLKVRAYKFPDLSIQHEYTFLMFILRQIYTFPIKRASKYYTFSVVWRAAYYTFSVVWRAAYYTFSVSGSLVPVLFC